MLVELGYISLEKQYIDGSISGQGEVVVRSERSFLRGSNIRSRKEVVRVPEACLSGLVSVWVLERAESGA